MPMTNEYVPALPYRTEPHFAASLSTVAKCGDPQQGDIPGIDNEHEALDIHAFENRITYSNQVVVHAVMKASTQLEDEIISTKIQESIAFGHDILYPKLFFQSFPLRNCLESVEASCIVLPYKVDRPRRSVSESTEDSEVIQTRCSHQ